MKAILEKIKRLEKELEDANRAFELYRSNLDFRCLCGKTHLIRECEAIQTHYYISPSGCCGGDYWMSGEMQIVCPDGNGRNRVLFDNVGYDRKGKYKYDPSLQFNELYFKLFKNVTDEYKDDGNYIFHNNYYFNENLEKFGILINK